MAAVRIVFLCVAAALVCATLRVQKPELVMPVAIAAGVAALALSLADLESIVDAFARMAEMAGVLPEATARMVRAAGIALLAEFGIQLCRDAGEGTLGARIEFGARVAILALALPLLTELIARVARLVA